MKNMTIKTTLFAVLLAATARADGTNSFKDDKEKQSYAIGLNFGGNWKQQDLEVDYDALVRGLKDGKAGTGVLTETEMRETLNKLSQELRTRYMEKQRQIAEKNKKDGEAFLAANKEKSGVITLPSGLQYKIEKDGTGESPTAEATVEVEYRGTLIDGTEFDSSAKAGKPFSTPANRVIKGWTEALTRMKAGSKWQLFIPSDLAYGERGFPPKIGPNSTLVFDVELKSFQAPPPPPAPVAAPPAAAPLTSDIIKVPSLEEMKKGAKIETIPASEVEKLQKQAAQTNAAAKDEKK